jgi:hypothetical protein
MCDAAALDPQKFPERFPGMVHTVNERAPRGCHCPTLPSANKRDAMLIPNNIPGAPEQHPIPWACRRLVVGTGANGALPVMENVRLEAQTRHLELLVFPTAQAIDELAKGGKDTNAILHVTC